MRHPARPFAATWSILLAATLGAGCSALIDADGLVGDTGAPRRDTGAPGRDTGAPGRDTGAPGRDTGTAVDTGAPMDGGCADGGPAPIGCGCGRSADCVAGLTCCSSVCTSINSDPGHCGGCGTSCPGGRDLCVLGVCVAADAGSPDAGTCLDDGRCMGGRCCDVMGTRTCRAPADPRDCGGCGRACGMGQVCAGAVCTTTGATPCTASAGCSGTPGLQCLLSLEVCVDPDTDPRACGAAKIACTGVQSCCGGICVDTNTDPSDCGSCGHSCDAGACLMGTCL